MAVIKNIFKYFLIGVSILVGAVFFVAMSPIWLVYGAYYLLTSPFEKKKFAASGYRDYIDGNYHFRITKTTSFKIFEKLKREKADFKLLSTKAKYSVENKDGTAGTEEFTMFKTFMIDKQSKNVFIFCDNALEFLYFDEAHGFLFDSEYFTDDEEARKYADATINEDMRYKPVSEEFYKFIQTNFKEKLTEDCFICIAVTSSGKKRIIKEIPKKLKPLLNEHEVKLLSINEIASYVANLN